MKSYPVLLHLLIVVLIQHLLLGCQHQDDEIQNQSFIVTDAILQNFTEDYNYINKNIIPANSYKIAVNLATYNSYAQSYGINPIQQNKIVEISIKTLLDLKDFAKKGETVNDYFLVEKGNRRELYQTIEAFLVQEDGKFENLNSGKFVFTNQDKIVGKYNTLIQKNDTLPVKFFVRLLFDDGLEVSDTLSTILFSNQ